MTIQDVSSFAAPGEVLSFWQLQKRVSSVGQVLYGFFRIPRTVAEPIDIVINPCGDAVRSLKRCAPLAPSFRNVLHILFAPGLEALLAAAVALSPASVSIAAWFSAAQTSQRRAAWPLCVCA